MSALNEIMQQLDIGIKPAGLDINNDKTKFMSTTGFFKATSIKINESSYQQVGSLKYLGPY